MRSKTQAARVRHSLRIEHQDIRPDRKPLQNRQHDRPFTKGQQARKIGKGNGHLGHRRVEECKIGVRKQDDSRAGHSSLHADIYPRDSLRLARQGLHAHARPQAALDFLGFCRRDVPRMDKNRPNRHDQMPARCSARLRNCWEAKLVGWTISIGIPRSADWKATSGAGVITPTNPCCKRPSMVSLV